MTNDRFPISYTTIIFSPKMIFAHRSAFLWWQNVILVLFLNALVLMPITLHYASLKSYPLEQIVRNGLGSLTEKTYHALTQGTIWHDRYDGKTVLIEDTDAVVAVLPTPEIVEELKKDQRSQLILTETSWILSFPDGQRLTAKVKGNKERLTRLTSLEAVKAFVNQQWYNSNRAAVLAFLLLVASSVVYLGAGLVIGIGSLSLLLTRSAKLFSLKSYSECLGLLVNCFGLPTLLAVLISFWVHNPIVIMNSQVFGTLLMLVLVFYKTQFRDEEQALA
ncbi:TPA: maltodextrose utilization protein malA [Streptococcus equi subsp. zooepidemicus]|uniref:maltodextrose utilization protein malA n=1 Tax=Streptococcus equi TaxID=1336 RepID=UPI001E325698|nr:maltodextrose utilization protein malA [Streptococcus equi]UFR15765.1 maltodextrose utilization protein malA [Streptococcus equi subsp. zooepidemicus]HEL0021341.1 maltodextrose utilization protein malA [Streptococcus equi subsp. zooepidemicus]HEL0039282.1 maltodextrose utilization protein malA [Streptococcus equi subsp. zooepidemicus]HEL0041232.1 maltodextrose utilization protein malA [Streptococcus equi subsp. zooepidemicus]HEL0043286.1 maltodextrose utilization protein malA [Streptococcus